MDNFLFSDSSDSQCDSDTKQTYFYQFLNCPFGPEYSLAYMVIVPDIIIILEIILIITIIYMIEKRIKMMIDPQYQSTYCIISLYIFKAL